MLHILAALFVVLTHSFTLSGEGSPNAAVGRFGLSFGNLGVAIFFVISGFLVTQSWGRSGGPGIFLRNRVARIWPGLTVVVLASVFVLGPAVTTLSIGDYASDPVTRRYLWDNLTIVFGPSYVWPGVFTDNAVVSVNWSLWTLPYELVCYFILVVVALRCSGEQCCPSFC